MSGLPMYVMTDNMEHDERLKRRRFATEDDAIHFIMNKAMSFIQFDYFLSRPFHDIDDWYLHDWMDVNGEYHRELRHDGDSMYSVIWESDGTTHLRSFSNEDDADVFANDLYCGRSKINKDGLVIEVSKM